MDFALTEEQLQMKALARDFARKEIAPRVAEYDREEHLPMDLVQKMVALGMMGGVVPEEYGGAGLSYTIFTGVLEELAQVCWVLAGLASYPSGLMGIGIQRYGTPEQKQEYLVPLAQGRKLAAGAVTEPHSGSDVPAMETTVRREGDYYVLNGTKIWITNVAAADFIVTFATLDRSLRSKGITAFLVDRDAPGLTLRPFKNKLGARPISVGEVVLQDCRVPRENRLGEEGQGYRIALCAVEQQRLWVAARAVGITQACLDESVRYAQTRIVFGQPIGKYQLIQSKITDMVVGVESARLITYKLAWLQDQGIERPRQASSIAKLYTTDVLMRSAIDACQIFGAYSCSDEYPVGRYFRDAKLFQIVEGTSEIHRILIAEYALGYRKES